MADVDKVFAGSIPKLYATHLVPLIFEPYAADLARRVARRPVRRLLEIAAGTGVLTRALAGALDRQASIVATDLNQAMLDEAAATPASRPIEWRQADAMALPFAGHTFDAVVCQFGAMFFPDRVKAFGEAHRVLAPGGAFLFSVWDRIADNEFADVVTRALEPLFPGDPPRFLARTPHGHHDVRVLARELAQAGFEKPPAIATVTARSRAASPRIPAVAYCEGTPLRNEIEARGRPGLEEATAAAAAAIAQKFGAGPVDGKIQALVAAVEA